MLFVVRYRDNPERISARTEYVAAHKEWLKANSEKVLVAGALKDEQDVLLGAQWLVEAESHQDVMALMQEDPFWKAGLRLTTEVLSWHKALPDRTVTI